jgi:transcriptional regulator with XRE-family HTH domain
MDKHSLNQTDLALRSGVSQPAINRILKERSKAKKPRRETLEKISGVLGVSPEQLTGQAPISVRLFDRGAVPVGRWETLTQAPQSRDIAPGQALICPIPHSDMSFALPVIGEAMVGDDGYREGDLIFIDPSREAGSWSRRCCCQPKGRATQAIHRDAGGSVSEGTEPKLAKPHPATDFRHHCDGNGHLLWPYPLIITMSRAICNRLLLSHHIR